MSMNSMEIPRHVTECGLQNYIENMVEEIILEDKAFDEYKDELQRRCEEAGVDYNNLECDLEDFLENMNLGIKSPDCLAIGMAMAFAMEDAGKCFVSQEKLEQIVEMWDERHPQKEYHPHNCPPKDPPIDESCYEEIKERCEEVYYYLSRLRDESEELQNLMEKYRIDDDRSRDFVERLIRCVAELRYIIQDYHEFIEQPKEINENYRRKRI